MKKIFKNVILIIYCIVCVQINGGKSTLKGSGCGKVSEENFLEFERSERSEIYFFYYESTNRKLKSRINLNKWIKKFLNICKHSSYDGG